MTERIPTGHEAEGQQLDQFDEAMQQFLAMPSRAAILLHTIAHELEMELPFEPLTPGVLTEAMNWAASDVFEEVPSAIATEASLIAITVLPAECPGETKGEDAAKLRSAAWVV